MFDSSRITTSLLFFGAAVIIGYVANKFTPDYKDSNDYEIIKKYILNDSPLYGYNRPKLWIHTKYEINARKWKDFYSRNNTDLNQPYIHLTIKSIINHCGNDFNICLIDDESFSKILPEWDIDILRAPEPFKSHYRELGLMQLLQVYGGMVVPNSFICLKNLIDFYNESIEGKKPFICEKVCRNTNQFRQKRKLLFCPDTYFMGAPKQNDTMLDFVEHLKQYNKHPMFSEESDFAGYSSHWCIDAIKKGNMNLVSGEKIGVKTKKKKTILIEDLMEESFLDLSPGCVGIYLPADDILSRTKYQWFAVLPSRDILESRIIVAKYLKASMVDAQDEYHKDNKIRSVVSI
jgi:hypothetical protein